MRVRSAASYTGVALMTLVCFAVSTSGCLANEYEIRRDELMRIASLEPEVRGHAVLVSQQLGERRAEPVEAAIPSASEEVQPAGGDEIWINVNGGGGGRSFHGASPGGSTAPQTSGGFRSTSGGGFHGSPPSGGFHGSPPSGGFHGVPAPKGGGGGGLSLGGGGGNGGDALLALVVAAIVGAAIATVVLAASEGARFEGHAELSPEQILHVRDDDGGGRDVALGDLTPAEAAAADHAVVMDDEGFGLRRLDHAPLDRKGLVFRFDLGAGTFNLGDTRASGLSAHIQAGAFPTRTFGLVFDFGIGTGTADPCCVGLPVPTDTMTRLSFGLEAQALPIAWGPLHLGGFASGGIASAGAAGVYESGPIASGGGLLELDLTSHMALAVRGGASEAWLPSGQSSAATITGGLAIY